jgi:exodeoxyribonuclease VII large subunit
MQARVDPGPSLGEELGVSKPHSKEPEAQSSTGPPLLTVSGLTDALKQRFAKWGRVGVEGEVSGLKRAGSGHLYFSLKEGGAVISGAIWRSRVDAALKGASLEEGDQVVCYGTLDIYAPRGTYSLMVERVEKRGLGERLAQLEKLKAQLRERGWFDRSRPLPRLPRVVGIVTSRDADGFGDFLRTRTERWPLYPMRLAHTRVQGPGAAEEIAQALKRLDASGVELICVVRGGGSIEDLWAFNEEVVADAIWDCSVPVVTGIGHEPDTSLADLVADHRAHTPTAAAQEVIPERQILLDQLEGHAAHLEQIVERMLEERGQTLARLMRSRSLRSPDWILEDRIQSLGAGGRRLGLAMRAELQLATAGADRVGGRLGQQSPDSRLARLSSRLDVLGPQLQRMGESILDSRGQALDLAQRSLSSVSPFAVLGRGYSITRPQGGGAPITSAEGVGTGDVLETILAEGLVESTVTHTRLADDGEGDK